MGRVTTAIYTFTTMDDTKQPEEARRHLATLTKLAGDADEFTILSETERFLKNVLEKSGELRTAIAAIESDMAAVLTQYSEIVLPGGHQLSGEITALNDMALKVNNTALGTNLMTAMGQLGTMRSASSRFSQSRDSADGKRVLEVLGQFRQTVVKLDDQLITEEGKKQYAVITSTMNSMETALKEMVVRCENYMTALERIETIRSTMDTEMTNLSKLVHDSMDTQGPRTLQSNTNAQKMSLIISAVGLLLGVAITLFIIIGLVHTLNRLATYAKEVAGGNFDAQAAIREKGEIGVMAEAIRSIPQVLRKTMADARELTRKISQGSYRARIDTTSFQREFAALTGMFNAVSDSYTGVLDVVPLPIMTCDKNLSILFLNKPAQAAVGGDKIGDQCADHLCATTCRNDKCLGNNTMRTRAPYTAETVINTKAGRMEVSVTATPLYDENNAVVGFIELLTDLTEIKNKQNAILRVAEQASNISNRVAAASEELSAQVEQVSRGAEMQRSRVESTASAMTEMNSTVLEVARNAGQASEQSEQTRQKANDGFQLVNQVVQAIYSVNKVTSTLHANMQELGIQAESIGGVMNVISDIADQTNLLALNAAIEAA